ncbi:MAG: UvrD-helicase domain-containing protein [Candidatus Azobacteroides sp.]|nr:UvrD-helicase domain-containing protein [Candidatus Azobacteroides sp.]
MLTVYRASAGSGKTFKLTGEYLKLLFKDPSSYRSILAVTFTNKATDEMKKRIIEELYVLSNSEKKSAYTDLLIKEADCKEAEICQKAKKILVTLLHDYSSFQISTIDRFFQQTMRAFTREIGLQGGYNIELDTEKVLTEAVDMMLSDLDTSDNKQLLRWLLSYSEDKVEAGKSWNIRKDIKSLGQEIFKENFKAFSDAIQEHIGNKDLLALYLKKLSLIRYDFEAKLKEAGEKALNLILSHGLQTSDFKMGARSPFTLFEKWAGGEIKEPTATFCNLPDEIDNWYTGKTSAEKKANIEEVYHNGLNEHIKKVIHLFHTDYINYQTTAEINRYFYTLGILGDIDKQIRQYTSENNIMLLSDTTQLLNLVIRESDPPFIYEKIGGRIQHYMIDEFQDTSGMQWRNFYPLMKESLASGNFNLIVGDVKQSIYRWRNSNWQLLESQIKQDFRIEGIQEEILDTNYRSCNNVIEFNNSFFTIAAHILQEKFNADLNDLSPDAYKEKIRKVYGKLFQHVPAHMKEKSGNVRIKFIDSNVSDDWKADVLEKLPEVITELQNQGFRLKDIAILVRTKNEGSLVAHTLLQYSNAHPESPYRYDVISDEALFINKSRSVKLLISMLRYLTNPEEAINQALAAYEYGATQQNKSPEEIFTTYFYVNKQNENPDLTLHFPEEINQELETIKQLSLYEITESLISLFLSNEKDENGEAVFIQAFQDLVLDFSKRHISDISSFLSWWDETGSKKTISMPDSQDAIRILTVHKSKGLGFKAVVMPFCDWEIDHKPGLSNILWLHTEVKPFAEMPLIPVRYSKKLQQTIFQEDYLNEKMHAYIDNLNLAYVAFTRAKESLILFAPKNSKTQKQGISTIADLLYCCIKDYDNYPEIKEENMPCISLCAAWDEENLLYEYGTCWQSLKEKGSSVYQEKMERFSSVAVKERLHLRLYSKGFFRDRTERIQGKLMHEILSKVRTKKDISKAIREQVLLGNISGKEAGQIELKLKEVTSLPETAHWFSGNYKVLNEASILQHDRKFRRPDRVMITDDEAIIVDYKFGEKEQRAYTKQLKDYGKLIQKMNYSQVHAFIWYVNLGIVEQVM